MADFPIVGIGSSAGGLEALEKLFDAMPPNAGVAFVVVAHLDPTRESHLTELLSRHTEMPVVEVQGEIAVEPDHVYVIAPDQSLILNGDLLHPSKPSEPRAQRRPVDIFFRSLAENQKERAVGIILSGTGTNGSSGLRFIKSEGGIAIAQDPQTAAYAGMPQSAISTGIVDLVLAPEKMASALTEMVRHPYVRQPEAVEQPDLEHRLAELLAVLRAQTDLNFEPYRRQTLLRRTHRRMGLHQIQDLGAYLERLRADRQEATALARDLTITVSGFFRDPQAWKILDERVIAPLVRERDANSVIRMWVPGCATGEEAYSLAMLFWARAEEARKSFDLRVFATDVADHILPTARAGLYPASIAADVAVERLERFFEVEDDSYQAKKGLRDSITFAPQNLLQDPPFSRLDLISCRNLLIYLEPDVQKKVLALFHFALREHGHLFLGPAESMSGQEGLFQPVSKKWRIYCRVGPTRHDIVDFPLVGPGERTAEPARLDTWPPRQSRRAVDPFQRALLERFAPASVLIDRYFDAHAFHGATGDYLQQPGGAPATNLLALARDGLQVPLRRAVQKAIADDEEASSAARIRRGKSFQPVWIVVRPLPPGGGADGRLVVSFFERETLPETAPAAESEETGADTQLEAELLATREDLRTTIEQMETANEELKASNEEIRSINEELQASNEELETSKEELQSLNEELNTTNNQLQAKVEELEVRTNDLNNLLNSTDVATLFLDRALRIRWFTPSMKALLELLPADIGRPISHFAQRFSGSGDLLEDARNVLERLLPSDTEVMDDLGRWYIRHIVPYRTEDDRINGVVVTFTEITERKRREKEVNEAKEFAEAIVDAVRFPLIVLTPQLRVKSANAAFYATFRVNADETVGRPLAQLGNRQWDIPELHQRLSRVLPEGGEFADFEIEHEFERIGWRSMLLHARALDGAQLILIGMVDLTERRRGEQERELLTRELSHRVKNILAVVQALATQTDHSRTVEEFRETLVGRLSALARAHSLVLDAEWRGADLKWLVEQAVQAYRVDHPDVVVVEGESVPLSPTQGLGLSLILHELGTNAAKYGALSQSKGRVRVSWQLEDGDQSRRVRLSWEEKGGPPVEPPAEKGFGTRLIERACTYELEGEVELDYAPDGLCCEVIFPVA
jgi:two-component system, chemotaxis family, CheB/CheR fusion protein